MSLKKVWNTKLIRILDSSSGQQQHYRNIVDSSCWPRIPIIGAPMWGVAGGMLAAQVTKAGGLGFISTNGDISNPSNMDFLEEQITIFRRQMKDIRTSGSCNDGADDGFEESGAPLCLGFVGHAAFNDPNKGWDNYELILEKYRPSVVQFFAPSILYHRGEENRHDDAGGERKGTVLSNVDIAHHYGAKFIAQVGDLKEARIALDAGVDAIIAQGREAGGHGLRQELGNSTLPLVSQVIRLVQQRHEQELHLQQWQKQEEEIIIPKSIPVIAAGGIAKGRHMASMLALGCDGVVLGTRLWASKESMGHKELQKELMSHEANCDSVIRTTVFDQIENTFKPTQWPQPYDSVGCLKNPISDKYDNRPDVLTQELSSSSSSSSSSFVKEYQQAMKDGDANIVKVLAGECVGDIDTVHESAYDIVKRIEQEAIDAINGMSQLYVQMT